MDELKIVDFTDVDLYPSYYDIHVRASGERVYAIRALIIEDIKRQQRVLVGKKTKLMLGDAIRIDFKFGHNEGTEDKEKWIDVAVKGVYKVTKIIPHLERNEIELLVLFFRGENEQRI